MKKQILIFVLLSVFTSLLHSMSLGDEIEPQQTYTLKFKRTVNGQDYYLFFEDPKKGPFDVGECFQINGHIGEAVIPTKEMTIVIDPQALETFYTEGQIDE